MNPVDTYSGSSNASVMSINLPSNLVTVQVKFSLFMSTSSIFNPLSDDKLTKSLDDDITSSFGNNFKMPRIEGIDDVEEKPPKKSDVQFIEGGLLGTGKKDFNDQADDILADTFDVEQRAQEER